MHVFRKENRRRILFTLTLTLLAAVLSFGFVSRAVEYLSIKQELERLSNAYRTIGWLTSADGNIAEGAKLIEESSYVETADARGFLWGTLTDLYNADLQGRMEGSWQDMYGVNNAEVLFWGTLKYVDEDWYEMKNSRRVEATRLVFTVSECITGYPDYAAEGGDVTLVFTDEMLESEGWELPKLTVGECYLVRAYYSADRNGNWPGYEQWVSAAGRHALTAIPVQENRLLLTEMEGNAALSELMSDKKLRFDEMNRHSMLVIATRDMSAMPAAQDVSKRMFLTEGRWLDGIDNNTGAAVCAVHKDFAEARGLHVGDTVELTFRTAQLWGGAYALGEQDVAEWQTYESETRQYVIAGIFDYMPLNEMIHNFSDENTEIYIPYGSAPEAHTISSTSLYAQNFSFILQNPQDTDAFLSEVQEPLAALGMRIQLIENDWEHFAVSANAMDQTACVGVLVFAGVLCLGFVLFAFLYVRQNRKSFGIARALGVPRGKCVRMCLSPMLCMSVTGIGAGALLSWRYALGEAEQMLTGMQEHAELRLSVWWLLGLVLVLSFVLTAAAVAGILFMARRPVMELLHDAVGGQKADNAIETEYAVHNAEQSADGKELASGIPVAGALRIARTLSLPMEKGSGKGTAATFRFVWRHVRRRPIHTILVVAVALSFLAAITWMQISIVHDTAEVERLYGTTEINGELVQKDPAATVGLGGAYLTQSMIDWLEASDYVQDLHADVADVVKVEHKTTNPVTGEVYSQLIGKDIPMRSTDDIGRFCEENHIEIDYADGYGTELFTTSWKTYLESQNQYVPKMDTPILVPEAWLEQYGLEYGQHIDIYAASGKMITTGLVIAGSVRYVDVGDGVSRSEWNKVLIPTSAWEFFKESGDWTYSSVQFTIDPAFNRELDAIKAEVAKQLKNPHMALLDADVMLWTSELRQVVEPFEKNLDLMKLLFPVTVAVSVIAGGGLLFLLLLQRTEEAALLRVLGNSRRRTGFMLLSEPVMFSMSGLLLGIAVVYCGMQEVSVRPILMFAGLYLGSCVLGAFLGTAHITRKRPLELLQVKE